MTQFAIGGEFKPMTPTEFNKLAKLHRLRGDTLEACRMVLVGGNTAYVAAQKLGISHSTIGRAIARLQRPICGECGKPIVSSGSID